MLEPPSLALDGEEREGGGNSGSVDSSRGRRSARKRQRFGWDWEAICRSEGGCLGWENFAEILV